MPPWHADPKHGKFANDAPAERRGEEADRPWVEERRARRRPEGPARRQDYVERLAASRKPDVVVPLTDGPYKVPARGTVKYKHFTVEPGFKEDKWVQARRDRSRATGPCVTPHAVVGHHAEQVPGDAAQISEGGAGFLAGYVPGQTGLHLAPRAWPSCVPAGAKLIFQMHYTPNGTEQTDRSERRPHVRRPKTVKHEVRTRSAAQPQVRHPARRRQPQGRAAPRTLQAGRAAAEPDAAHAPARQVRSSTRRSTRTARRRRCCSTCRTTTSTGRPPTAWQSRCSCPPGRRCDCAAHFDNSAENPNNPDPTKRGPLGRPDLGRDDDRLLRRGHPPHEEGQGGRVSDTAPSLLTPAA